MEIEKSISVRDLTKKFGDFTAVDHISFDVAKGEIRNKIRDLLGAFMFGGPEASMKKVKVLRTAEGVKDCNSFGSCCHVSVVQDGPQPEQIESFLKQAGFGDCIVVPVEPGIEDCFMRLT